MCCFEEGVKIATATCTGRGHRAAGAPCQDMVAECRAGQAAAVALADGAGSRPKSHLGARAVVELVAELLCTRFDALWAMEDRELAAHLVAECLAAMQGLDAPMEEMGGTLLFFALDGARCLAGHLGDGALVRVTPAGAETLSPPENGRYKNETYFITDPDAAARLRLYRPALPPAGTVLLMSDGAADSLYDDRTGQPARACATLAAWLRQLPQAEAAQVLYENLEEVLSANTPDDLSIAMLAWGAAPPAGEDEG